MPVNSSIKTLLAAMTFALGSTAPAFEHLLNNPKELQYFETSQDFEIEFY